MLKKAYLFFLGFFFFFIINPSVSAATITVCTSGCYYTIIQAAINNSAIGDTVLVKNGNYAGFTVDKKITITGENVDSNDPRNNGATINGQVIGMGTFAFDQGPTVRGFRIIGGLDPVVIQSSTMTVKENYIKGQGDGISINKGAGVFIGNRIESMGDDNIDVDSQSGNVIIEGNYLLFAGQDGIEIRQQPVNLTSRISMRIRNNRIEGSREDGLQIMDYANFTNRHYVVERNLFLNNRKAAIGLNVGQDTNQSYTAAPMPEPLYIVNNTIAANEAGISGGANVVALNNIFSQQNLFDLKNVGGQSVIKYSFFNIGAKLQGSNNIDNSTTFNGNPLLNADYTLGSGSPAIDKGIANFQHSYQYDGSGGGSAQTFNDTVINLSGQFQGSAPDLGWKESGMTGASPTRTPTPGGATPTRSPTPTQGTGLTSTPTPTQGANPHVCAFWKN